MEIRDFLNNIHSFSKTLLIAIKLSKNGIKVNGELKTVRYKLQYNDILKVQFPKEKIAENLIKEDFPLHIVYEDEAVIVLNKPSGMAVMPSANHKSGTLANHLLAYYAKKNIPYTIHVVTRLDRDTSGLVLIAKNRYIHSLLSNAIQKDNIERIYKAVIEGHPLRNKNMIDAPIGRKQNSIIEREVTSQGKNALTYYNVEKSLDNHSLVTVTLKTGRTHQIRVHFSYMGFPLAGDDLYGGSKKFIGRQALHCNKLTLKHPLTNELVTFNLDIPKDMKTIILKG